MEVKEINNESKDREKSMGKTVTDVVKEFQDKIENKNKRIQRQNLIKRKNKLIKWGLYDRVYSDKNVYSDAFPFKEHKDGVTRFYKRVAKDITDEEWEILIKKENEYNNLLTEQTTNNNSNTVSTIMYTIGFIIYFIGTIIGISQMSESTLYGIIILFSTLISGSIFIGFSETIKLLQLIKKRLSQMKKIKNRLKSNLKAVLLLHINVI